MGKRHFLPSQLLVVALGLVASLLGVLGPAAAEETSPQVAFFDVNTGEWTIDEMATFYFGIRGDHPMLCDWDGNGVDTVGIYRSVTGHLFLRNSNDQGFGDIDIFYGNREDLPVCGDWNDDGIDTIGIYRPSEASFFLRNSNTQGFADIQFSFGGGLGMPLAGDWNGDGIDTVGMWQPWDGLLRLANQHTSAVSFERYLGFPGDRTVVGDWDGNGRDTVGAYRPAEGRLYLAGFGENPSSTLEFDVGHSTGFPVAGVVGEEEAAPPPDSPAGSLLLWDTVWQIAAKADRAGMEQYVDRLADARGIEGQSLAGFWFSVVNINQDINTPNGFGHTFGSFDNPSDDYLADIDTLLTLAYARGLRAGIVVAWDGSNQFAAESGQLNIGNAYAYGNTIASRLTRPGFPARSSVAAWVMAGDATEDCCGGKHDAVWAEVVRGIRAAEAANGFGPVPVLLHTAPGRHLDYLGAEWLDAHSPQTGHCFDADQAADWLTELQDAAGRTAPIWGNGEMRYEGIQWNCHEQPISASDVLADINTMQALGFMENFLYGFDLRWDATNPGEVGMSADGVSEGLQRILDQPGLVRARPPLD